MSKPASGSGIIYRGEAQVQCRPAICGQCQRYSTLRSYTARKWLALGSVPIVPLGSARIVDECPVCGHRQGEASADQAAAGEVSIPALREDFARDPQNARAAQALHHALREAVDNPGIEEVGAILRDRFPEDPDTLAYLAEDAWYVGEYEQARQWLEKSLQIDPSCRRALAVRALEHLREGRLAEGRALLAEIGAESAPDPDCFVYLGEVFQDASRHADALEMFRLALEAAPALAHDKVFRKAAVRSELAVGQPGSVVPPLAWHARPLVRAAAAIVLLLGTLLGSNYYIRENQRVFVVNGYPVECVLRIAGGQLAVPPGTHLEIGLPEGEYTAEVLGPRPETIPVKLSTPFWERWSTKPAYVINPGGAALLVSQSVAYSEDKKQVKNTGTQQLHLGEKFVAFPQLDYPFEPFPETLDEYRTTGKFKFRIDIAGVPPEEIFQSLRERGKLAEAMNIAEWQLQMAPEAPMLLGPYFAVAQQLQQQDRAYGLLGKMLEHRPVLMKWHRFHQDLAQRNGLREAVLKEYDTFLQMQPDDPAAHYLRGRLATGVAEARPYYLKAAELATNYAYAQYALGYCDVSVGDWPAAKARFEEACRLDPEIEEFFEARFKARLAVRDFEALQTELEPMVKQDPTDYVAALALFQVWLTKNELEKAKQVYEGFRKAVPDALRGTPDPQGKHLLANFQYAQGDFEGILSSINNRSAARYYAIVELGRTDEMLQLLRPEVERMQADALLISAVALRAQGRASEADEFWNLAVQRFEGGLAEQRRVAALLKQETPPSLDAVKDLLVSVPEKIALTAALAQKHPGQRAAFLEFARTLNVLRAFPYHLVNRLIEAG